MDESDVVVGDGGGQPAAYVQRLVDPLLTSPEARQLAEMTVHWLRNTLLPGLMQAQTLPDGPQVTLIRTVLARGLRLADTYARSLQEWR